MVVCEIKLVSVVFFVVSVAADSIASSKAVDSGESSLQYSCSDLLIAAP